MPRKYELAPPPDPVEVGKVYVAQNDRRFLVLAERDGHVTYLVIGTGIVKSAPLAVLRAGAGGWEDPVEPPILDWASAVALAVVIVVLVIGMVA